MLKNTRENYGIVAKWFHWVTAIIIIGMLCLGFLMGDLVDKDMRFTAYSLHKSFGLLLFGLVIARLWWHFKNQVPTLPSHIPSWQRLSATLTHKLLYLFMVLMPLSGWVMSTAAGRMPKFFGLFAVPFPGIDKSPSLAKFAGEMHEVCAYILVGLLLLHIAAIIKHYVIDHYPILKRML